MKLDRFIDKNIVAFTCSNDDITLRKSVLKLLRRDHIDNILFMYGRRT